MNSITSFFSDGKALDPLSSISKEVDGLWVHRRQKENSKDKPESYFFLQVILKNNKQRKSAQGIFYFYSGQ